MVEIGRRPCLRSISLHVFCSFSFFFRFSLEVCLWAMSYLPRAGCCTYTFVSGGVLYVYLIPCIYLLLHFSFLSPSIFLRFRYSPSSFFVLFLYSAIIFFPHVYFSLRSLSRRRSHSTSQIFFTLPLPPPRSGRRGKRWCKPRLRFKPLSLLLFIT